MNVLLFDDGYKTIKADYECDDVWRLDVNSTESKYSFWMTEEQIKEFADSLRGLTK